MDAYKQLLMKLKKKRDKNVITNSHIMRSYNAHNDITATTLDSKRKSLSSTISSKRSKQSSFTIDDTVACESI